MIKIWPDSLDANWHRPMGSFLFCKDLVTYNPGEFEIASSIESCDCIMLPQFSNCPVSYIFDFNKAEYIEKIRKPIILQNDGGGIPAGWEQSELGKYIWGKFCSLIKVFFSVECYPWHRKELPDGINYVPFDFVGYSDFGLGLREVPPLQSKEDYLKRPLATSVAMNVYPPTRDVLWELLHENHWSHYSFNTNPTYSPYRTQRISWEEMANQMKSSRISFAPDGATAKTERHLFVPAFSAMMLQEDSVEFAFPWIDGENCFKLEHDFFEGFEREKEQEYKMNGHNIRVLNKENTREKILGLLANPDLIYEVYKNGYENARNYELPNYFKNHIGTTIKKYL